MAKSLIWVALGVIGLIIVGSIVVSLLGTLLKWAFYLVVGAVVVGGALYVVRRARGSLRGNRFRQLR